MKLALVTDLHSFGKTLEYLEKIIVNEKPDGVVFSGDISMNSDTSFLERIFEIIQKNEIRAYMICGNADEGAALNLIDSSEYSINQTCREGICGLCDHEEALADPRMIVGKVLVTHRPPPISILRQKLNNAPEIHISGHLHSKESATQFPSTLMIQVPTLQDGKYAILELESKKVKFSRVT